MNDEDLADDEPDVENDLGPFALSFDSWRRVLAGAAVENRTDIFNHAADEVASFVARGLDRTVAADQLVQLGSAFDVGQPDEIQYTISRAFARVELKVETFRARKPNGHDDAVVLPVEIPARFPFPIDGSTLPRRPWLVPGLLMRKQVTVMVAPAGSGKSLLTLQVALICSAGVSEWNGWRPRGRFRCLIINSEEDGDELCRRLFAAREFMNIPDDDVRDSLAFAENPESIIIARADARTKTVTRTPMLERIVTTIIKLNMDVVIVDPFAETFEGDENSNSELKWAAALWREVARRTNTAVWLVHHTKKYAHDMAGDPDAGRGGSALVGVARIVTTLFTMTAEEAEALEIDAEDRVRYLRFDDAKTNMTLINLNARWFYKETVVLPNAGDDGEPADEIGVLKPYAPKDALSGMTSVEVVAILDEIRVGVRGDGGEPTGDPYTLKQTGGGSRWAGTVVQRFSQCSEKQAKDILKRWIKNRFLEEIEVVTSTSRGKPRKGLKVIGTPGVIDG